MTWRESRSLGRRRCNLLPKMPTGKLSGTRILVGRPSGEAADSAGTEGIIISGKRTEGYSDGCENRLYPYSVVKRAD